jgi:hypothetical protein
LKTKNSTFYVFTDFLGNNKQKKKDLNIIEEKSEERGGGQG